MLITDRFTPILAKQDIKCFKVMVSWMEVFYVCPPAFQNFINNNIELEGYHLNTLYETESIDENKDYRINGEIWAGFFHTFCDIESAINFIEMINNKLEHPENTKHPELYILPEWAKLVIINARIPQWSLYYEWSYQWTKNQICEKTYASNKVIYDNILNEN